MNEWRETTLNKLGRIITGKTPLTSHSEYYGGPIPFVTPSDFDSRRIIDSTSRYLTEEGASSVNGSRIPANAVMVSCIGSDMRKTAIAGHDCVTNQQINSLIIDTDDDPFFVYYNLSTRKVEIRTAAGGSAQPIMNKSAFGRLDILLPPPNEQHAIAGLLSALDNKIESNRHTSRMLERLARTIFRAWFVDFEPVKAKSAGARSFPGMLQEVFDALPTRLVESALGPVPEGWGVESIGDAVSVRGGGTPSTTVEEYWENGSHCWLTPKDLSGMKDHVLLSTARKITDKGLEKISSGLLPVGTVLLSSRAPVGYLVLSGVPTAINQGFIAMVCDGPLPPLYVFHWTQSVMDEIKSRASGTTFPEISKTAFRPIKVCLPIKPVLEAFTAIVEPLFDKLAANIRESQSLEKLRNYLLPKLLSGELRVQCNEGADNV